jgi:eukaryotic-like serine/threonine-protein kinase
MPLPNTLAAGSRFGPYDVLDVIGAGGMGEVYRARDSVLHRDVALKVLPGAFALDRDRLGRFEREAQVLASLNHPNIGAIYGFEEAGHVRALVLELIEGSSLDQRIAQGPIPLDDALPIAHQICDALEAAHAKGIVHRDLKPANIKVRPDGIVKVLDFGLAKMLELQPPESALSRSPTMMESMPGMVLGTAAYMSPEQSRGREVERTTDVWAFGCVLFEMLAGRAAFEGGSRNDVMAAILKTEPNSRFLPASTPESIRRLLRRCLQKDLKHRLRDIGDARLELDEARSELGSPASRSGDVGKRRVPTIGSVVAVACASAAIAGTAVYFWSGPRNDRVYRSTIQATLTSDPVVANIGNGGSMSPDGRLAFIGLDSTGNNLVYIRALDGLTARPLAGSQGAQAMFWSPDSRFLAFIAGNTLKTIDVTGNAPASVLHQALVALPGSWNSDDVILFSPAAGSPLFRIPSKGGTATPVTSLDTNAGEGAHAFPYFLPDGRHFLYLAQESGGFPHGVYVGSLDSTKRTRLFETGSNTQYARRTLFFLRGSTLMAQPFDATRMALRGEAVPLADRVQVSESTLSTRTGAFSVSETGDLIYRSDVSSGSELLWRDRTGREIGKLGDRKKYLDVVLSPNAARASVTIMDPGTTTRDVWLYDVARSIGSRFTVDPEDDLDARWSADGLRVAFASRRGGHLDLYSKSASGSDDEQLLLADHLDKYPQSWSPAVTTFSTPFSVGRTRRIYGSSR